MDSLESLILRAREGDADAYGALVRRFQDMAVGYAYSTLRDFSSAEDAAQEAFLEAYRCLDKLREPAAFPGWFRRIVFKHCDRITRSPALATVALAEIEARSSREPTQVEMIERRETKDMIEDAINSLPAHERAATVLYYIGGYSQKEIGAFLDAPVTTIKKRLHTSRTRLREMLLDAVEETLRGRRPSRDEAFAVGVIEILKAARAGDVVCVKELLARDPRLAVSARDQFGNTAFLLAINFGHYEVAELLFASGARPDIYEAAAIGRTETVAELLEEDARRINSYSPEGWTPLHLAAHFGYCETVEFLLARGADANAVARHPVRTTPLHGALFGKAIFGHCSELIKILLARGADVNIKRGGDGWSRSGWTALHYIAGYGFADLIEPVLDRGADIHARDAEGHTPLTLAVEGGHEEVAEILRRRGARE